LSTSERIGYCRGQPSWFMPVAFLVRVVVGRVSGGSIWACGSSTTRCRARGGGSASAGRSLCSRDSVFMTGASSSGGRGKGGGATECPTGSATARTGRCTPPPNPNPNPGFRAVGHRIRSGRSPPESVQTNPRAPTTPDETLGANVVTSGDLLRDGRCLVPPPAPHLDVLPPPARTSNHRKEDEQCPISTSCSTPTE
jgi:hypothetical protein